MNIRHGILQAVGAAAAIGCLVAAVVLVAAPRASAAGPGDLSAVDAHVRAAMEASAIPGLAYAVVEEGRVVHLAAFGIADPSGRAMTPQTPIVIGSVGKSITALAIRQLVEAGRIDVDARVTRYLPWFALEGPEGATEQVTIRSLLDHTSGLATAAGQDPRWYVPGRAPEDVVRGLAAVQADHPAGTRAYSNVNYVVLGVVVEAVSGQSYGEYVRTHIFDPLGMSRTYTDLDAAAGDVARGHRYLFGVPVPFDEPYPSGMVAAGYQVSTAEDMAQFVAALANGGVREGVDVSAPAAPPSGRSYGTDWQLLTDNEAGSIISQSGSTLSSNADILELPSRRLGVVVLLNSNPTQLFGMPAGAADIALDVLRLSFGTGPGSSAPTVRTLYLVIDAVLFALVASLLVHAARARTWRRRLVEARHRRRFIGRSVVAGLVLPLAVLLGVPLWIGSTGSSPAGDVLAGWRFILWTLPELALALLLLAFGGLAIGVAKLASLRTTPVVAHAGHGPA